jgi:hypothetical protein
MVRPRAVEVPERVCLRCFNEQQRRTFPFLVYCPHHEVLALVSAPSDSTIYPCNAAQVSSVIAKLSNEKGTDALLPPRNGL